MVVATGWTRGAYRTVHEFAVGLDRLRIIPFGTQEALPSTVWVRGSYTFRMGPSLCPIPGNKSPYRSLVHAQVYASGSLTGDSGKTSRTRNPIRSTTLRRGVRRAEDASQLSPVKVHFPSYRKNRPASMALCNSSLRRAQLRRRTELSLRVRLDEVHLR